MKFYKGQDYSNKNTDHQLPRPGGWGRGQLPRGMGLMKMVYVVTAGTAAQLHTSVIIHQIVH